MSSVELAGPPEVMTQMRSKYLMEPTIDNTQAVLNIPDNNGRVILRTTCHEVHPSIRAASNNSVGIPSMAAMNKTM